MFLIVYFRFYVILDVISKNCCIFAEESPNGA